MQQQETGCTENQKLMSSNIQVQRICQFCNTEFTAKTTVTKYCSDNCAKKAYKKRKREEKIKASDKQVIKKKLEDIEELRKKEYLTITETCSLLSVSRWTIWRAIKNKELEAGKIGRRRIIRRSDIEKLFPNPKKSSEASKDESDSLFKNQKEINLDDYYTVTEAQKEFKVSPSTLWKIVERESISKFQRGKYVYLSKSELEKLFSKPAK